MNPFHALTTLARRLLVRLRPPRPVPDAGPRSGLLLEGPVQVPVPRRSVPRSLAVIRSAMLPDSAGELRIFTVLATSREGRMSFAVRSSMNCSEASRAALGLDAFERLLADAEQYHQRFALHIVDRRLRSALSESGAAFPRIDLVESPAGSGIEALVRAARQRLDDEVAPVLLAPPSMPAWRPPPMRVGTDASKSRRPGVGVGVAAECGEINAQYFKHTRTILHGELQAIELALDLYPGRRLLIQSDSLHAVRLLTGFGQPQPGPHAAIVERTRPRLKKTCSRVGWVRGHSGHDLNEAADRASRAARRQHEFGFEDDWLALVLGNITEDCFSAAA